MADRSSNPGPSSTQPDDPLEAVLAAAFGPASELAPPVGDAAAHGTLGDFRIVHELGRGGMGIVYEAEQISLGRRVALKVLPFAATLDPRQLQRFKNEAHAAAQLHHTNIVPVYGVGCDRGTHYFAMQFIEGQSLAAIIAQLQRPATERVAAQAGAAPSATLAALSTERSAGSAALFPAVARVGVQAAEALAYAHQMGVIHRDIKPANLLLDVRGNLWITDFGLARIEDAPGPTLTGDVLGTLRYMSPEQALGGPARVDHRTDVYALGATLYELLTLRPAHDGTNRQEIVRRVAEIDPVPARRVNSAIPVELETIVHKALTKEAEGRYATAQELADDLERFLRDEPIRARRPTLLQRARKWARRHRAVVRTAVAVSLAALLLFAVGVGWVVVDQAERRARTVGEATTALEEASRLQRQTDWPGALAAARRADLLLIGGETGADLQRRAAEMRADLELVVKVETIRLGVGEGDDGFDFRRMDIEFAQAFREYGLDVDALEPDEAAERIRASTVRLELASALGYWAVIRSRSEVGRERDWSRLLQTARAIQADAVLDRVHEALARKDAKTLAALAESEEIAGLPPASFTMLGGALHRFGAGDKAVALLRKAQQRYPGDFWINYELGTMLATLRSPQWDDAVRFHTAALALRPHSAPVRANLGHALRGKGALTEAMTVCREAIQLQPGYVTAHEYLGNALSDKGKYDEAIACFTEARRLRPERASVHYNQGLALARKGSMDEAIACFEEALRLRPDYAMARNNIGMARLTGRGAVDQALADFQEAIKLDPDLSDAYVNLGVALARKAQYGQAAAAFRRAIALKPGLAQAHHNLGVVLGQLDAVSDAIAAFEETVRLKPDHIGALQQLARLLATCPDLRLRNPPRARALAQRAVDRAPQQRDGWHALGAAQYRLGDWQASALALQKSVQFRKFVNGFDGLFLSMAHWQLGEKDEAKRWYERGAQWMDTRVPKDLQHRRLRAEAAELLGVPLKAAKTPDKE